MRATLSEKYVNLLPIGQLITIVPASPALNDQKEAEGYSSRVEDVLHDAIVVSMPMHQQSLVPLPLKSEVAAYFHREGARYYFRAVVGAKENIPFPVLYLTNVGEVKKEERRSHVRIEALLEPIEMVIVNSEISESGNKCPSLVVNISAGGLGLVCRGQLPVGGNVHIVLDLPNNFGRLDVNARVVRCEAVELGGVRKWRAGVAFKELSRADQDRVAAFVLFQQRLLRRRGLL
ncbi:MAG: flagellar brake protein [Chloroflexota bacterium]|jgi:c-di-GMP-binding flagellar brake protein YcgR